MTAGIADASGHRGEREDDGYCYDTLLMEKMKLKNDDEATPLFLMKCYLPSLDFHISRPFGPKQTVINVFCLWFVSNPQKVALFTSHSGL